METIKIGKITSPVGLKGEVKIISYSEDQDRFEMLESVFVRNEEDFLELAIEGVRYKGPGVILKLEGIDDRNASEKARGMELFMDAEDLPELEEGQFYVRDIVGFEVRTAEGVCLGDLKDVLTNTAQDIYVVRRRQPEHGDPEDNAVQKDGGRAGKERDLMIPGVPEFIRCVDMENKTITVELPEGLLEL